jgi:hypothetical protein
MSQLALELPVAAPQRQTTPSLTLEDLRDLYQRYVPAAARHPNARKTRGAAWWPAHELGHLLTVPPSWIDLPLFGMDVDVAPSDPSADLWFAYELAAMDVSRQLLLACDRAALYYGAGGEIAGTDPDLLRFGDHEHAQRILRRRGVLRLPTSRAALEAKIRRAITARDPEAA